MVLSTLPSDIYAEEFKLRSKHEAVDMISDSGCAWSTGCQSLVTINVYCALSLPLDILYCPFLEIGYSMNIPILHSQ